MKIKKVALVLGSEGSVGREVVSFLKKIGYIVYGKDEHIEEKFSMPLVMRQADLVVFAVPLSKGVKLIKSVNRYSRIGQLYIGLGSKMQTWLPTMLKSSADVACFHSLESPPKGFIHRGGVIAVHFARVSMCKKECRRILARTKARVEYIQPVTHDYFMKIHQNLLQASAVANAMVVAAMHPPNISKERYLRDFRRLRTKSSRAHISSMSRTLLSNPSLLAEIQLADPEARVFDSLITSLMKLKVAIECKKKTRYLNQLEKVKSFFGTSFLEEMMKS